MSCRSTNQGLEVKRTFGYRDARCSGQTHQIGFCTQFAPTKRPSARASSVLDLKNNDKTSKGDTPQDEENVENGHLFLASSTRFAGYCLSAGCDHKAVFFGAHASLTSSNSNSNRQLSLFFLFLLLWRQQR